MKFCRQIFEKMFKTKFKDKPSSGIRVVPCARMDRQIWRGL